MRMRDSINFSFCGEKVNHRSYGVISRLENGERYYYITRMVWTKKMEDATHKDYALHLPCCKKK